MSQPPHPMAGAQGHGAPIAPLSWKWRCGNRLRDMYFYSPEGKLFRSRTELASYLGGLPNGPSPGDFCWRVTPEIVKTGVWNKEEESPQKTLRTPKTPKTPKAPKAPKTPKTPKTANSPKAPRLSTKTVETESPSKRSRNSYTGSNGPSQIPLPSSYNGIQFSQVEPLAIRAPGPILLRKTTNGSASPRPSGKGKKVEQARKEVPKEELPKEELPKEELPKEELPKEETPKWNEAPKKTETPKKPDSRYTFREILSEPSSFKLLFDTGNMDRFKEDAMRLDSLSRQEIWELRKLLVDRNPQMGNMSKYPNAALKVFLRLLGTDGLSHEPSDQLGKVELADLCVKLAKVETAAP